MVIFVPDHVKPWFRVSVCHVIVVPAVVIANVADRVRVNAAPGRSWRAKSATFALMSALV